MGDTLSQFNPDRWRLHALTEPGGDFDLVETDVPSLSPSGMLLAQELSGVCGTDASIYRGAWSNYPFPLVLGHENVGRIWKLGKGVTTDFLGRPIEEGDRVVLGDRRSCARCYSCVIAHDPWHCENMASYRQQMRVADTQIYAGVIGGGFSNMIHVDHERALVFRTDLPSRVAVLFEPVSVLSSTLDIELAKPGLTVIMLGTGMVGLAAVAAAKWRGASRIIAVGAPELRLQLAAKFGADVVIDHRTSPEVADILAETPRGVGADVVFDCTGVASAMSMALSLARPGGQVANVGIPAEGAISEIRPYEDLFARNVSLRPVRGMTATDWVRSLQLLENFDGPWDEVVTHVLPVEDARRGIEAMASGAYELDGQEIMKMAFAGNQ